MKKIFLFTIAITAGLIFYSCSYDALVIPEVVVPTEVSFSADVEPIFTNAGCTGCHPGIKKPDLTAGKAYSSLTSTGTYVNLANPAESLIYTKAIPESSHSKKYTYEEAAIVLAWISNGAQDN